MILSILIPTLPSRENYLSQVFASLLPHIGEYTVAKDGNHTVYTSKDVEILIDSRTGITTGEKRNELYRYAYGKYSISCDDDDWTSPDYIPEILEAAKQNPDCITFCGWMSTDGKKIADWELKLGNEYRRNTAREKGFEFYERHPNHLAAIKSEIARMVPFPHKVMGEDYDWSCKIQKYLKTEVHIPKQLYHYKFRSKK